MFAHLPRCWTSMASSVANQRSVAPPVHKRPRSTTSPSSNRPTATLPSTGSPMVFPRAASFVREVPVVNGHKGSDGHNSLKTASRKSTTPGASTRALWYLAPDILVFGSGMMTRAKAFVCKTSLGSTRCFLFAVIASTGLRIPVQAIRMRAATRGHPQSKARLAMAPTTTFVIGRWCR